MGVGNETGQGILSVGVSHQGQHRDRRRGEGKDGCDPFPPAHFEGQEGPAKEEEVQRRIGRHPAGTGGLEGSRSFPGQQLIDPEVPPECIFGQCQKPEERHQERERLPDPFLPPRTAFFPRRREPQGKSGQEESEGRIRFHSDHALWSPLQELDIEHPPREHGGPEQGYKYRRAFRQGRGQYGETIH